jgi:hypothetical protein
MAQQSRLALHDRLEGAAGPPGVVAEGVSGDDRAGDFDAVQQRAEHGDFVGHGTFRE